MPRHYEVSNNYTGHSHLYREKQYVVPCKDKVIRLKEIDEE
jgi:hypothetical protein